MIICTRSNLFKELKEILTIKHGCFIFTPKVRIKKEGNHKNYRISRDANSRKFKGGGGYFFSFSKWRFLKQTNTT